MRYFEYLTVDYNNSLGRGGKSYWEFTLLNDEESWQEVRIYDSREYVLRALGLDGWDLVSEYANTTILFGKLPDGTERTGSQPIDLVLSFKREVTADSPKAASRTLTRAEYARLLSGGTPPHVDFTGHFYVPPPPGTPPPPPEPTPEEIKDQERRRRYQEQVQASAERYRAAHDGP